MHRVNPLSDLANILTEANCLGPKVYLCNNQVRKTNVKLKCVLSSVVSLKGRRWTGSLWLSADNRQVCQTRILEADQGQDQGHGAR